MALTRKQVEMKKAIIKKLIASKMKKVSKKKKIRQNLDNLTIIVTNAAGVPRDTTGWTATLTRGTTTRTANFDDTGVAVFKIATLTEFAYTLRVRNEDGELQGSAKSVPANIEAYVLRLV
jgi:hypothetical protein